MSTVTLRRGLIKSRNGPDSALNRTPIHVVHGEPMRFAFRIPSGGVSMAISWVRGAVRNGQVVLDPPLDVPDGTVLAVTACEPGNPCPVTSEVTLSPEVLAELAAFWRREKTWAAAEKRIQEIQGQP